MSQIQTLLSNIDDLTDTIISMAEKINKLSATQPPSLTFSEPNGGGMFYFMTNRQIAKKLILLGGNALGVTAEPSVNAAYSNIQGFVPPVINASINQQINSIDENIAHLTVYGKFVYDVNGRLIDNEVLYPECVAKDGEGEGGVNHMPSSFPLLEMAKDIKNEFKLAIAGIRIKAGEIGQAFIDLQFQLVLAITTLAASATIMPPGSGLPVALSAVKAIPAAFMAFQTRIMQIIPYLKPLSYISIIIPEEKIDAVIIFINTIITIIKTPFDVMDTILSLITALAGSTPPVPGIGDTPAEPIVLQPTAEPSNIPYSLAGRLPVTLKANASKGSWQYNYSWKCEPKDPNFVHNEKEFKVFPRVTTKYIVTVTDTNGFRNTAEIMVNIETI